MLPTTLPADVAARLPTPKGLALVLIKACRSDDANLDQISALVRTDPALSGRLLGLANVAALGGRNIASVEDAVGRLGLARVSQTALAFSLIDQHGAGACSNFNYAAYWNHSLLMAAAAREFGALHKLGMVGDLFTSGLLAQIGRLAMATAFPAAYSELVVLDLTPAELLQREQATLQTDHLQLSAAMLDNWGIPAEYARPFGLHEEVAQTSLPAGTLPARRAQLAHTAWQLSRVLATDGAEAALDDLGCMAALQWLHMDRDALLVKLLEIESVWRIWLALISRKS
jgi:two-component system cell cycle response regulator